MDNKIVILALIFFAAVGMASAAARAPTTSPATGGEDHNDGVIGTISGGAEDAAPIGGPEDAAPVGGPVPAGVFENFNPATAPASGATVQEASATAGAMAAAGFVGSFFF